MAAKTAALFAIYLNFPAVRRSVDALKRMGFRDEHVSVLFLERAVAGQDSLPNDLDHSGRRARKSRPEPLIGGTLGLLTYIRGAVEGVVAEALVSMGIPAEEAEGYEKCIRSGGILLSVRCSSRVWRDRTRSIIQQTGAQEICQSWVERVPIPAAGWSSLPEESAWLAN
jgi:hypothetical protein